MVNRNEVLPSMRPAIGSSIFAVYQGHIIGGRTQRDEAEVLDLGLFARNKLPRQPPPLEGSELDRWFFEIVSGLFAKFQHQED